MITRSIVNTIDRVSFRLALTFKPFHAGALVVVLQVLAGAAVLARRGQALVDVLFTAVARVAYCL